MIMMIMMATILIVAMVTFPPCLRWGLFIRPKYTWGPIYESACPWCFADFIDETLADEMWSKFWNLVNILNCGQNSEMWLKNFFFFKILKFDQNFEIWSKFRNDMSLALGQYRIYMHLYVPWAIKDLRASICPMGNTGFTCIYMSLGQYGIYMFLYCPREVLQANMVW